MTCTVRWYDDHPSTASTIMTITIPLYKDDVDVEEGQQQQRYRQMKKLHKSNTTRRMMMEEQEQPFNGAMMRRKNSNTNTNNNNNNNNQRYIRHCSGDRAQYSFWCCNQFWRSRRSKTGTESRTRYQIDRYAAKLFTQVRQLKKWLW